MCPSRSPAAAEAQGGSACCRRPRRSSGRGGRSRPGRASAAGSRSPASTPRCAGRRSRRAWTRGNRNAVPSNPMRPSTIVRARRRPIGIAESAARRSRTAGPGIDRESVAAAVGVLDARSEPQRSDAEGMRPRRDPCRAASGRRRSAPTWRSPSRRGRGSSAVVRSRAGSRCGKARGLSSGVARPLDPGEQRLRAAPGPSPRGPRSGSPWRRASPRKGCP